MTRFSLKMIWVLLGLIIAHNTGVAGYPAFSVALAFIAGNLFQCFVREESPQ